MSAGLEQVARPGRSARPAVSVEELKRAWYAVQAGDYRRPPSRPLHHTRPLEEDLGTAGVAEAASTPWTPAAGEWVLPVVGVAGSVGASTVALALAMTATQPARVIECCSPAASGLAAASTAELGFRGNGTVDAESARWRQGSRDQVLIERTSGLLTGVEDLPAPTPAQHVDQLTILDAGWDAAHLTTAAGWLSSTVRTAPVLVVVTRATVPAFRRLEATLELLDLYPSPRTGRGTDRIALAVVGAPRKKWPRGVAHSAGPAVRDLLCDRTGTRVVEIPHDRSLAVNGVDSRPLPEALTAAAARLLSRSLPLADSAT